MVSHKLGSSDQQPPDVKFEVKLGLETDSLLTQVKNGSLYFFL